MKLKFLISIISFILFFFCINVVHAITEGTSKVFTVIIDPGHGGKDPGAIGATLKEKEVNLAVALLVGEYIKANHINVKIIFTRKTDVFIPLNDRADIANKSKGDLFISIHANSVKKNKTPFGTETYTLGLSSSKENLEVAKRENSVILLEDDYKQAYEGFDPNFSESYIMFEFMQNKYMDQSIAFASEVQKEFKNTAQRSDRGVKQAEFLVLRKTSMPSVLVEMGFLSNPSEETFLISKQGRRTLARSIYNAFKQYKKEYDRKLGISENETDKVAEPDPEKEQKIQEEAIISPKSRTIYKVQILASDVKLLSNSAKLKGYKNVDFYIENGLYKSTIGESSEWPEIAKIRRALLKDFKDAFIINFIHGVKQPIK